MNRITHRALLALPLLVVLAVSAAAAKRGFPSGSAPPILAATISSRTILPVACALFIEAAARFACSH